MSAPRASNSEVDEKTFREVAGNLASGVTIITTTVDDVHFGMTASSVTTLSADPALMVACINNSVPTSKAIALSGKYAVNVLSERHGHIAMQFASPRKDKFSGVDVEAGVAGVPILADALANIECEVIETIVGGTHSMFIGRVVRAVAGRGQPLTYFRGGFGRFERASDEAVYRRARELVLNRVYGPQDVITTVELANRLGVDGAAAFYALTRLSTDSLVERVQTSEYVVVPFDRAVAEEVFEARLTIELGVIELRIGKVSPAQLSELRARIATMADCLDGDSFLDFDRYLDANHEFHRALIALSGNQSLLATFEGLSTRSIMAKSFGATAATSQRFIEVQGQIVDALDARDLPGAQNAVREYCAIATVRAHEVLATSGGEI